MDDKPQRHRAIVNVMRNLTICCQNSVMITLWLWPLHRMFFTEMQVISCLSRRLSFNLLHLDEFSGLPGLVEPRLFRTIETKQDIPALPGNRPHPVGFVTGRRGHHFSEDDATQGKA